MENSSELQEVDYDDDELEELELEELDDDEYEDYEDYDDGYNDYVNFKDSIIQLDDSLLNTINHIEINIVHADVKVNLLDYLPWFKKGYTTSNSLDKILHIYQYLHDTKLPKIYNLHDYIKVKDFTDIKIGDLDYEQELIKLLYDNHRKYQITKNDDIDLESFISTHFGPDDEWVGLLILSKLGLYVAIILHYEWVLEELLNEIDPRDYNNEAYHLSLRLGNDEITNMIKNKIIELNWLDKEVLIKEFGKYDFFSTDIIKHYQSMKY